MAFYDRKERYDSGLRYDAPPPQQTKKHMAQVKLELRERDNDNLQVFAEDHVAAMTNNPNFPTPDPAPTVFATALSEFQEAETKVGEAQQLVKARQEISELKRKALEVALTARGVYVQGTSQGDATKIRSSGFGVRDVPAPIGALPAPVDFMPTMGDEPGEMDLAWSRVHGARSYIQEYREQGSTGAWSQHFSTRSRTAISGLTSGKVYVFRVAALGAAGQSPWSLEAARMAP